MESIICLEIKEQDRRRGIETIQVIKVLVMKESLENGL